MGRLGCRCPSCRDGEGPGACCHGAIALARRWPRTHWPHVSPARASRSGTRQCTPGCTALGCATTRVRCCRASRSGARHWFLPTRGFHHPGVVLRGMQHASPAHAKNPRRSSRLMCSPNKSVFDGLPRWAGRRQLKDHEAIAALRIPVMELCIECRPVGGSI